MSCSLLLNSCESLIDVGPDSNFTFDNFGIVKKKQKQLY